MLSKAGRNPNSVAMAESGRLAPGRSGFFTSTRPWRVSCEPGMMSEARRRVCETLRGT